MFAIVTIILTGRIAIFENVCLSYWFDVIGLSLLFTRNLYNSKFFTNCQISLTLNDDIAQSDVISEKLQKNKKETGKKT